MKYFFKFLTTLTVTCGIFISILDTNAYALKPQQGRKEDTSFSIDKAKALIDEAFKIVKTGGKVSDTDILLKNAIGLIEVDPTPGRFINGRITVNYDSSLLSLEEFGWFGDWGIDSTLPSPPVETVAEDIPWLLQTVPNSQLTVNTVLFPASPGSNISTLQVEYDWVMPGHIASSSSDFNFFGVVFKTLKNITFGEFKSSVTLPYNDFFRQIDVDSLGANDIDNLAKTLPNFNRCIPPDSEKITLCGVSVVSVPEHSSVSGLLALGTLGAASTLNRKLKLSQSTHKELEKVS